MLKTSKILNAGDETADLILIRGLPGSGKSTLARKMTDRIHLEADQYFELGGSYKFDPSKLKQAHQWCLEETGKALREGKKVVVSNTFTQVWEMQPYLNLAKSLGCSVSVMEATGNFKNVHGVPDEALSRMRSRWEKFSSTDINAVSEAPADIKSKYLAFQISPNSRVMLLQKFSPKYPRIICDHITVDFGVNAGTFKSLWDNYTEAKVEVIGYVAKDGVEALAVSVNGSTERPSGGNFHITLSLDEGHKPAESNKLIAANGFEKLTPISIQTSLVLLKK